VTIDPQPIPANFPPDVRITFPATGSSFLVDGDGDADIVLSAEGSDYEDASNVTFQWYARRSTGPGTWGPFVDVGTGASPAYGFSGGTCGETYEVLVSGCDAGTGSGGTPTCTDYSIVITIDTVC